MDENQIEKIKLKREKDREQQYAIMNWERESVQWEEAIYKKLTTLKDSVWLFYSVYLYWEKLRKEKPREKVHMSLGV